MALPQREVKVRDTEYKFNLVGSWKALTALKRVAGKSTTLIPNLMSGKTEQLNSDFLNLITEEFDELFSEFVDINQLYYKDKKDKQWKLIGDFDEHFAGSCMAPVELLYKVIMENDKDFFPSLPSLIMNLYNKVNEFLLQSLSKEQEIPNLDNIAATMMMSNAG